MQIRPKLINFEGRAKKSKITSTMKWWSKCWSMVIAKTASRNVGFKVSKIDESLLAALPVVLTHRETSELCIFIFVPLTLTTKMFWKIRVLFSLLYIK